MRTMTDEERELARENIALVFAIVKRFGFARGDRQDWAQTGMVGLCKAAQRYDRSKGRFAPFAARCIQNEVLMALRDERKGGRGGVQVYSYDEEIPDAEGGVTYAACFCAPEDVESIVAYHETLARLRLNWGRMSERERAIVRMRKDGLKEHEIAARLNITQSYVSRLHKAAKRKLGEGILEEAKNGGADDGAD